MALSVCVRLCIAASTRGSGHVRWGGGGSEEWERDSQLRGQGAVACALGGG